jgi:lipoprotein-releasing system permease protein
MSDTVAAPRAAPRQARPFGASERMIALRYLGATKKGRGVSFISVIGFAGIALSVATLIVVMAVMQGFRTTLLDQILGVNGHVYVMSNGPDFDDYEAVAARVAEVPGVTKATPVMRVAAGATNGDRLVPLDLICIDPDALSAVEEVAGEDRVLAGDFENFGEGRRGGDEIALAVGVASQLGLSAGDAVTIIVAGGAETPFGTEPFEEKTYRVGAVFKIGNSQYDSIRAYLPLEQARLLTRGRGDMQVEVRIEDPQNPGPMRDAIAEVVGPFHYVLDWTDLNRGFFDALQIERSMVRIILSLLVLVATLLIVSNLVMRVKDKTADIAVLRTMGATRSAVMRIFFLSGMLIGVTGTAIGVALGVAFVLNITAIERALSTLLQVALFNPEIYFLEEIPAELQWAEINFVIWWTLLLSAAASLFPAWKAARLDPVEALRYE